MYKQYKSKHVKYKHQATNYTKQITKTIENNTTKHKHLNIHSNQKCNKNNQKAKHNL